MPFDKITVTALTKRSDVSPNTFYYHYEDIYDLLDCWLHERLDPFFHFTPWQTGTKVLMQTILDHRIIFDHIVESLSREQLERYVFESSVESFADSVMKQAEGKHVTEEQTREIVDCCRYMFIGFFLHFLWDHKKGEPEDVDREVQKLVRLVETFVKQAITEYDRGS